MAEASMGNRGYADDRVCEQVEELVRTALHEIRQPVAAVLALAEAARGLDGTTPEVRSYLDQIIAQVMEVSGAAASVLERPENADSPVDVDEVLDSVLDAYALTWSGTLTRRGCVGGLWSTGDRSTIRRCLVNIVDNAVRAAGPAGRVQITVHRGARSAWVLVEDDGPGFGRGPSGTGIGLPTTRRALQGIRGHLSLGAGSGMGGACVAMSLPLRAGAGYTDGPGLGGAARTG
ncbi:sensor histidine kinase [Geodermatophilus ruber]|uniref:histidine kinase n=1 Tax=Geodermatophilus ruber TaxID=504800 RepID=A0A1I4G843_9ACTN|nr:HAMP domain-containing sensor histidine kinase [Geodermatophilus ruber]SFL25487.1 His Kinase A (phospho-acceptor) domain-containing protein [Geodermatophilus ruber]